MKRIPRTVILSDAITTIPVYGTRSDGGIFPMWMGKVSTAPTRRLRAELSPNGYGLVLTPNGSHKRGIVVTVWSGDTSAQLRVVITDKVVVPTLSGDVG